MIDTVQLERDLTTWAADKLYMTVDNNIFRGSIPPATDAVAVKIGYEMNDTEPHLKTFNIQILGKYSSRDEAMRMLGNLNNLFPCYGESQGENTFVSIIPRGGGQPYSSDDNGKVKTFFSLNLLASVK